MNRTRREALGLVGGLAAGVLSGCLAPGGGDGRDGTDSGGGEESPTLPPPVTETDDGTPTDTGDETPTETEDGTPSQTPRGLPDGVERVDTPPYDIEDPPECAGDGQDEDYDPRYLCANMPAEPSLAFEQQPTRGTVFRDEGLQFSPGDDDPSGDQLYATLLTDDDDLDRLNPDRDEIRAFVSETDFERRAVLAVQTGWGSGSILPHLKRVEATDTGIHAFGCYTRPCVYTADYTARTTVARFERPDALETGLVSLTVDPTTRYTVATGEGVVTIDR
ncbi:hypothetical protein ACOZ4I_13750 [Haloarcula salina]|uniref:hypothetical protein n=1 Tax=Haloarcula salina TaxID=1429914 RepID=UPI003C6F6656